MFDFFSPFLREIVLCSFFLWTISSDFGKSLNMSHPLGRLYSRCTKRRRSNGYQNAFNVFHEGGYGTDSIMDYRVELSHCCHTVHVVLAPDANQFESVEPAIKNAKAADERVKYFTDPIIDHPLDKP